MRVKGVALAARSPWRSPTHAARRRSCGGVARKASRPRHRRGYRCVPRFAGRLRRRMPRPPSRGSLAINDETMRREIAQLWLALAASRTCGTIKARQGVSLISPVPNVSAAVAAASSMFGIEAAESRARPKIAFVRKRSKPIGHGSSTTLRFAGSAQAKPGLFGDRLRPADLDKIAHPARRIGALTIRVSESRRETRLQSQEYRRLAVSQKTLHRWRRLRSRSRKALCLRSNRNGCRRRYGPSESRFHRRSESQILPAMRANPYRRRASLRAPWPLVTASHPPIEPSEAGSPEHCEPLRLPRPHRGGQVRRAFRSARAGSLSRIPRICRLPRAERSKSPLP